MAEEAPLRGVAGDGQAGDRGVEDALYRLACQGDEQALERLIARYREPLFHYVRTILHDARDVEEVIIDSFAALAASRGRYQGKSTLKTYLFSIARHQALRQRGRGREVPVEEPQYFVSPSAREADQPLDDLFEHEDLRRAMVRLPLDYRQVLQLVYLEGMSYREAGEVMGKSVGQVSHLAANGKSALRRLLGG